MRLDKFGDTYDVVKQSLLGWLAALGPWAAHPMFTEEVSGPEARAFATFLDVPLLSLHVLGIQTDRSAYFAPAKACGSHLFLDPDTGLSFKQAQSQLPPGRFVYGGAAEQTDAADEAQGGTRTAS